MRFLFIQTDLDLPMSRLLFLLPLFTTLNTHAQVNVNRLGNNQIQSGNLIATGAYTNYENQPFIPQESVVGTLQTTTGKIYDAIALRYNAERDLPEFQLGENVYRVSFPVREFILGDSTRPEAQRFRNGFAAVDNQTPASFYEVLYAGKSSLLKRTKAALLDVTSYNSATKQKRFDFNESYYVARPGAALVRVKRDKRSLLEALADKAPQVEAYLTREKLRLRDWADVAKVLRFYDGL